MCKENELINEQLIDAYRRWYTELASKAPRLTGENPAVYAVPGKIDMDFSKTGDTDLYYGIGKYEIKYTCSRGPSSVRIRFSIEDKYNFDYLRSISGDGERGIKFHFDDFGNLANDAGLLSQADSVISIFYTYINFEKTIELRGVYL